MRVQNVILLGILALVSSWPFAQAQSQVPGGAFRIYTYDSMAGKEGFAAQAISAFKKKCECEVELKAFGDASQVLNRVEFEVKQGSPTADVVLGVDQNNFARTESWRGSFSAATQKKIKSELNRIAAGTMRPGWIPLDWGVYAWMSDNEKLSERKTQAPERMDDLLKPEFKRRLLLQDPRTSTPGLAWVLWVFDQKGPDQAKVYFGALKSQWLTLTPGWDQAYGLFMKGEAPLVWSYLTSEFYHRKKNQDRYRALSFKDGAPIQVEGVVVRKNISAEKQKLADQFAELVTSRELQEKIPETQWMFPVRKDTRLPNYYREPLPALMDSKIRFRSAQEMTQTLDLWERAIR